MKFLLILSLLISPLNSFAKEPSNDSKAVTLGFFLVFCPMCVPAVVNELSKEKSQKETKPKTVPVRALASESKKTKNVSK